MKKILAISALALSSIVYGSPSEAQPEAPAVQQQQPNTPKKVVQGHELEGTCQTKEDEEDLVIIDEDSEDEEENANG